MRVENSIHIIIEQQIISSLDQVSQLPASNDAVFSIYFQCNFTSRVWVELTSDVPIMIQSATNSATLLPEAP